MNLWNEKKARWYSRAIKESDFPEKVLRVMRPYLKGCQTALDIGAGCGALTLPLSRELKRITALEPSPGMVRVLKEEAERQGLKNIYVVPGHLGEVSIEPHDLVLIAHVPGLWEDPMKTIEKLESLARRWVFTVHGVGPDQDRFFFKELYPLILGKEFSGKADYLSTYNALHRAGIYAHISIIEYDLDQPFESLHEAVEFWKEYLHLETDNYDSFLGSFLEGRLLKKAGRLIHPIHRRNAVIYWSPEGL